jgi:hypothetical protein
MAALTHCRSHCTINLIMKKKNLIMGLGIALVVLGAIDIVSVMVWLRQRLDIPDVNMFGIVIPLIVGFACLGIGTFLAVWRGSK